MIKSLFIAYNRHAMYRETFKELNGLSNRELYDLGIDRSQIEKVAHDSTFAEEPKNKFGFFKDIFKTKIN